MTSPIDLRTACPGWEVETHTGAKLKIYHIEDRRHSNLCNVWFVGYLDYEVYRYNGEHVGRSAPALMDIVRLTPLPLTVEQRLAEIAKIARQWANGRGPVPATFSDILTLAEGRQP